MYCMLLYMQYLLCGLHWTDVALRFCDETKVCVVEFILQLCDCGLFVVSALLYITVGYEQTGYRANNTGCNMAFSWLAFNSDFTQRPLLIVIPVIIFFFNWRIEE